MKKKNLTDKEFADYYSGKMNEKQAHEFEARATDDDFVADATDGFMDHPEGLEKMASVKEKFYQKNKISTGFSSKSIWILSSAALLLVVFGLIILSKWNYSEPNKLSSSNQNQNSPSEPETKPENTIQSEIPEAPITEEARVIEEEKPIAPEKVIVEQKEILQYEEELPLEKLDKKSILTIDFENQEKQIQKKKIAFHYLADFKVVDYSDVYDNGSIVEEDLTGLPAKFEQEKQIPNTAQAKKIKYEDYLEEALRNLKTEDFTSAIKMLEKIESTFQNDLNASFYQGIAYFNLRDYKNAKNHFINALSSPYYIFDEESEWYLYLCHKALGEKKEAAKLLNRIKERRGFYYKRAIQEN